MSPYLFIVLEWPIVIMYPLLKILNYTTHFTIFQD